MFPRCPSNAPRTAPQHSQSYCHATMERCLNHALFVCFKLTLYLGYEDDDAAAAAGGDLHLPARLASSLDSTSPAYPLGVATRYNYRSAPLEDDLALHLWPASTGISMDCGNVEFGLNLVFLYHVRFVFFT